VIDIDAVHRSVVGHRQQSGLCWPDVDL